MKKILIVTLFLFGTILSFNNSRAQNNPATDWFKDAKYGYLFHYCVGYNDIKGSNITEWNASVNAFDVNAFADNMEAAGAGYVVITLGQNSGYFCSPNTTYESLAGYPAGAKTSTRDLPLDLYNALNPKGIKLMFYLSANAPSDDKFACTNLGLTTKNGDGYNWDSNPFFIDKWAKVIQTWSDRYGSKLAGWWFDGFYKWTGYNSTYAEKIAAAVKHGNPNSIVTLNQGGGINKNAVAGDYEDYTAGEEGNFNFIPAGRWLKGLQWHVLSFMGTVWSEGSTKYSDSTIINNIKAINLKEGVVTMDARINKDGSLSSVQLAQMKAIKAAIKGR